MQSAAADAIPSLDKLLHRPALQPVLAQHGRTQVTLLLREHLARMRKAALAGSLDPNLLGDEAVAAAVAAKLTTIARPNLRAVFNLTGTVLHTNLGRAVLPEEAIQAATASMRTPVNLEYDLRSGRRGERDALVEPLLRELTGAQAATVVNNNAAAVLLILSAFAARREVIVSRGELVEIGGSFRIPDIMRQAAVKLIEVGTTNRTHLTDYAGAIGARTALIMKVHTSNYVVQGFTSSVPIGELSTLARRHSLPLVVDLGSGSIFDLTRWGLPKEPTARESLAAGADLISFSGDKLLGGPQAGLITGRADLIAKLNRHPLKRALRVGKSTLAALEAVLGLYRTPEFLAERLTTLRQLTRPLVAIREQAERLQPVIQGALGAAFTAVASAMMSQIGSGALPTEQLPSYGLVIRPAAAKGTGLERLDARLRGLPRPVIGRIAEKALWLDLRCLDAAEEAEFVTQWSELGQ
jgi:L-seryl-tRNA(Ser) seleniumtransferase